jgi:tripartite-type tricarboxylate transporter receptor subunit TctC
MHLTARRPVRLTGAFTLAAACLCASGMSYAQAWPAKPVRMIVPIAGGGSTDAISRLVGTKLGEIWGHPVLVENRPGGSTMIGAEVVARATPDGYTILMATSAFPANFSLFRKVPYKLSDFAPVSNVAESPNVLAVHPSVPAKSVNELIALLRSRPGQINYGSGGVGGSTHLAAELFKLLAKVDVVHIPYKGGGPAVTDLLGGQISMIFGNLPAVLPHVNTGRINVLAIASARRSPTLPNLPTMDEAGVRGFEASTWAGLLMPAGTPQPIITKLYADLQKIYAQPDMKERMATGGFEAIGNSPKEFAAYIDLEVARWEKVIRAAGIKAE